MAFSAAVRAAAACKCAAQAARQFLAGVFQESTVHARKTLHGHERVAIDAALQLGRLRGGKRLVCLSPGFVRGAQAQVGIFALYFGNWAAASL